MFKYVSYTKVVDELTTHEFRGGDDLVKVNYFSGVDVVSIEADVEADIDALITSQDSVINCTIITQAEFKTAVINTPQIKRILEVIEESYNKEIDVLISLYPSAERETWTLQLEQAKKFKISGDELDAPFLQTLANAEGGTVLDFADTIIANAKAYEQFAANALVNKRALKKQMFGKIGL